MRKTFATKDRSLPSPLNIVDLPKHLQYFVVDIREGKSYGREHLVVGLATDEGHVRWLYLSDYPTRHVHAAHYMTVELAEIA